MAVKSFKLYFLNSPSIHNVEVIRRVQFPSIPSWNQFLSLLQSYYPDSTYLFKVKWVDGDGDEITMNSQQEWSEAISSMSPSLFKFYIFKEKSESSNSKEEEEQKEEFQPEIVPEFFYSTDQDTSSVEHKSVLQKFVPEIISNLMANGALPSWAAVAMRSSSAPNSDVLLDVNISVLSDVLHKRAFRLLNDSKTDDEEAARYLRYCVVLTPDDSVAFYNLACALSRLRHLGEALLALQNYVRLTDNKEDLEAVKKDDDLLNLRETEEFKKAFPSLCPPPVEEKKPEVVPEAVPSHFRDALDTLHEVGFRDDQVNLPLLEEYNGDVSLLLQDQLESCLF